MPRLRSSCAGNGNWRSEVAGSSFGHSLVLTTFGESHGAAIGGVIDGCPSGLKLDLEAVQQ